MDITHDDSDTTDLELIFADGPTNGTVSGNQIKSNKDKLTYNPNNEILKIGSLCSITGTNGNIICNDLTVNVDSSGTGETGIIFRNYTKNMAMRMNHSGDFNLGIPANILDGAISDPFMTILYNGNVGIGTNNPLSKLHIDSTDAIIIPFGIIIASVS